jgi:hypothetical protein
MLTDTEYLKCVEPSVASGDRTTVETSAEIFTGVQAYRATDLVAVEEPLELQLAYGRGTQRSGESEENSAGSAPCADSNNRPGGGPTAEN